MLTTIRNAGVRPQYCYAAGLASIALSYGSYFASRNTTGDSKAKSARWGIFVGHWAPTFFALGNALKLDEMD